MGSTSEHRYRVRHNAREGTFTATCDCGWTSEEVISAGLASSTWDQHVIAVAQQTLTRGEHRIADVETAGGVTGGYRLRCTCGWTSVLIPAADAVRNVYRRHLQDL